MPVSSRAVRARPEAVAPNAVSFAFSVADIAAHNGIPDANRISVGQVIYIPGPLAWIVDPGDTLGKIAAYYGMTAETVAANNGVDVNALPVFWFSPILKPLLDGKRAELVVMPRTKGEVIRVAIPKTAPVKRPSHCSSHSIAPRSR